MKRHLIIINTYNKPVELNKTITSINQNLPKADICIISKGNETRKKIKERINFFYKVKNIGRESQGYIWAFLKYPNYEIYTFLQDEPKELYGEYYGNKIKIAEKLILMKKSDFITGMKKKICDNRGYPQKKDEINLIYLRKLFKLPYSKYNIFAPGACFTIKGDILRNNKERFIFIIKNLEKYPKFAWEMERIWMGLSKNPFLIFKGKVNPIKNISLWESIITEKDILKKKIKEKILK